MKRTSRTRRTGWRGGGWRANESGAGAPHECGADLVLRCGRHGTPGRLDPVARNEPLALLRPARDRSRGRRWLSSWIVSSWIVAGGRRDSHFCSYRSTTIEAFCFSTRVLARHRCLPFCTWHYLNITSSTDCVLKGHLYLTLLLALTDSHQLIDHLL